MQTETQRRAEMKRLIREIWADCEHCHKLLAADRPADLVPCERCVKEALRVIQERER